MVSAPRRGRGGLLLALYAGVASTLIAATAPFLGRGLLVDHISAGYPTYGPGRIDDAVAAYQVILTTVAVTALISWAVVIVAVTTRRRWSAVATTAAFVAGLGVGLTALLIKDTNGETGLPASLGLLGLLPCVPGLVAVTLAWRVHDERR